MPSQSPRHLLLSRPIPQPFIKQKGGPIENFPNEPANRSTGIIVVHESRACRFSLPVQRSLPIPLCVSLESGLRVD